MNEPAEVTPPSAKYKHAIIEEVRAGYHRIAPGRRRFIGRVLALLFVIALSFFIFSFRDQTERIAVYGYPGIFLFALLTSATVILPAPGLLIVFSMGAVLHPFWVAVAAGSGATLGELSGYLAGISGRAVVENTQAYEKLHQWMLTHYRLSSWLILFLAFLPLPLFDMAGIAAGALKMPLSRFLSWVWVGKVLKMLAVAYLGFAFLDWLDPIR